MINFLKLFNILIFIVFASNIVLAYFFDTLFLEQEKITQLQVLSIILLIDVIIVLLLVKIFYNDPISELKYLIQKFYIGELKGKDINIKKSLNPNINYIVIFFGKTLDTLKNIKDEFLHGKEIKGEVSIGKEIQEKMLLKRYKSSLSKYSCKIKTCMRNWWGFLGYNKTMRKLLYICMRCNMTLSLSWVYNDYGKYTN
ncbi:MAG: hypothetical protein Q9M97_00845 [Candidatus Gracilibacteria bacterium]|nr:hypothetical protein [Candidatus Gracilibacteria bacterium]